MEELHDEISGEGEGSLRVLVECVDTILDQESPETKMIGVE